MEQLLTALNWIPEYRLLVMAAQRGLSAAVTGIGQINRSHLIAGLYREVDVPIMVICQDEMAGRRLQEELKAFLGETAPILPGRELTLYDTAVASRGWEQKRLRQLWALKRGQTRLQILPWEALSLRTMPPEVLEKAAFRLETGKEYDLEDLLQRLTASGYSRCSMVEGPGQFALRGGILDFYSPASDAPIRAEFFGDELDTMGWVSPTGSSSAKSTFSVRRWVSGSK